MRKVTNKMCVKMNGIVLVLFVSLYHDFGEALSTVYSKLHGDIILNCSAEIGTVLSWRRTGKVYTIGGKVNKELAERRRFSIVGNEMKGEYNLKIVNVSQSDVGEYHCFYSAGLSSIEYSFNLQLMVPPRHIEIKNGLEAWMYVAKHSKVSLECSVKQGIPNETLSWIVHGGHLVTGTKCIMYNFTADEQQHLKLYTCQATHPALTHPLQKSVQVLLKQPPIVHVIASQSQKIIRGQNVSFVCTLDSSIGLKRLLWTFNNISLHHQGTVLVLKNVEKEDDGMICCQAQNSYGKGAACTLLEVEEHFGTNRNNSSLHDGLGFELQIFIYPTVAICIVIVLYSMAVIVGQLLHIYGGNYTVKIENRDNPSQVGPDAAEASSINSNYDEIDETAMDMYLEAIQTSNIYDNDEDSNRSSRNNMNKSQIKEDEQAFRTNLQCKQC